MSEKRLYSLDDISWPWKIRTWCIVRSMPKHLDIEPVGKMRRGWVKRIRKTLVTGAGDGVKQEYFSSPEELLLIHRLRAKGKIERGQSAIEHGQNDLILLDALEKIKGEAETEIEAVKDDAERDVDNG